MSHYTHLTIDEREKARVLWEQGLSFSAIAEKLNRDKSTISREFKRNSKPNGEYIAHQAQKQYKKRKNNCGSKLKLLSNDIFDYVLKRLQMKWTPEQIAGRAKLEKQVFSLSYNTIYRALDKGIFPLETKEITRFKSKYKRHKTKTEDKRGKIPDAVNISERSAGANNRSRFGHWESDTVFGM